MEAINEPGVVLSHNQIEKGSGVVRLKLKVKREDLRRIMVDMSNNGGGGSSMCLEQRLSVLKRRVMRRSRCSRREWSPQLQSIPEEI